MWTPRITTALAVLGLVGLVGLLGACSDAASSQDAGTASPNSGGAAGQPTGGGGGTGAIPSQELQDAELEYARCMREHGIDMPDPQPSDGGYSISEGPAPGQERATPEEAAAAVEACDPILQRVNPDAAQIDPQEQADMQDQMVAVARCMRERGYDMPDPQVDSQGHVSIGVGEAASGDLDQFSEDMAACQQEAGIGGSNGAPGVGG